MYLFIDTISVPGTIAFFDEKRHIVSLFEYDTQKKEFDTLIENIDEQMSINHLEYSELQGIVVVIGPGSFTGTRVTTLVANTLAMSFGIPLFPITAWQLFESGEVRPCIIGVTKRECLLKKDGEIPELISYDLLPPGNYVSIAPIDFIDERVKMDLYRDLIFIIERLDLSQSVSRVQPLYAKEPNVTL